MPRVEKTVFISYRRADRLWALSVFTWLTQRGFDAFIDYEGIGPGDFERAIVENIVSRAHFLILLTPETLARCKEPGDWIRREIEQAMHARRNIVPVFLDGFTFSGCRSIIEATDSLSVLPRYNGLQVEVRSFEDDMLRLQRQFLNVALEAVIHPVSEHAARFAAQQQTAAAAAPLTSYGDSAFYGAVTDSSLRNTASAAKERRQKPAAPVLADGGGRKRGMEAADSTAVLSKKPKPRTAPKSDAPSTDSEVFRRAAHESDNRGGPWVRVEFPTPKFVRIRWTNAVRVLPTRFPTVTLFDRAANAEEFEALRTIEELASGADRFELGDLEQVPKSDRLFGPGSGPIMSAFTHVNPGGSVFSDGRFGVFYAAKDRRTAIAESKSNTARFLAATGQTEPLQLQMRLMHVQIDAVVCDLRGAEFVAKGILQNEDHSASRALAIRLRAAGVQGVVYRNLFDGLGQAIALFNPKGASRCLHAAYLMYAWNGSRFTDVYERVD